MKLLLILSFATAAPAAAGAHEPPAGYVLTWSDDFEASGLPDPGRWTADTSKNAQGWANKELQYYSANRPKNARVQDGRLIIEAHKEALDKDQFPDWGGQQYTSARLVNTPADWRYGHVVIRAMLPCSRGTWPAIWMLPTDEKAGWPGGGEIDIMEHVGHNPGVVHASVHTGAFNHMDNTQKTATIEVPDACTEFHDYTLTWTPERIEIGLDGRPYFSFANDGSGDRATWPFDKPFRLILNVAVGGTWGGSKGVDDAVLPQRMEVDSVKFYRKPD